MGLVGMSIVTESALMLNSDEFAGAAARRGSPEEEARFIACIVERAEKRAREAADRISKDGRTPCVRRAIVTQKSWEKDSRFNEVVCRVEVGMYGRSENPETLEDLLKQTPKPEEVVKK